MTTTSYRLDDRIKFVASTPEGLIEGTGRVQAIMPAAKDNWLKVMQDSGVSRMIFAGTSTIEVLH